MKDILILEKQVETIIRKKFELFICSISYRNTNEAQEIGTGNLVTCKGEIYIFTCNHIINNAGSAENLEFNFANGVNLIKGQASLFQKDEKEDIALLKIKDKTDLKDLRALTLNDFGNFTDLREVRKNKPVFVVTGFPTDFVKKDVKTKTTNLIPLFYQTVPLANKKASKTKIYLDYPYGKQDEPELPRAYGLSGAGIWKFPPILSSQDQNIWSPTSMKFIAMQRAWEKGTYSDKPCIIGSRINKIFDWLS